MLRINDKDVELPAIDSLNLDEAIVIYRYTGTTLDKLFDENGDVGFNPSLFKALIHIGAQRAHPDMTADELGEAVGQVALTELFSAMPAAEEGDSDGPPAEPPAEEQKSDDSESTSGGDSETSSETPEPDDHENSGTSGSDSSQSPRIRSVA